MRLSSQATQAARTAEALAARDAALVELAAYLDPDGVLSCNRLAEAIASRLARFEANAWQRIRTGRRVPQSAAERALCALVTANTPRSARRLFDLCAELGLGL